MGNTCILPRCYHSGGNFSIVNETRNCRTGSLHRFAAPVRCTGSLHRFAAHDNAIGMGSWSTTRIRRPRSQKPEFQHQRRRSAVWDGVMVNNAHTPNHSLPNCWVTQIIPTDPRRRPHGSRPGERERGNRPKSLPQRTVPQRTADVRSRERYRRRFHPGNRERADGQLRLSPIATLRDMSVHVGPHPATRTRQNVIIGAVSPPTKHH